MSSDIWAGADIRAALGARRVMRRQAAALAVFVGGLGMVAAARLPVPRQLTIATLVMGVAALAVEAAALRYERGRIVRCADRLILAGYRNRHRDDDARRVVELRKLELCSAAYRVKLAREWRELLSIAMREGMIAQYPWAYISRAAVRENAPTIARIVVALEHGPGDPVAELRLRRQWQRIPLPAGAPDAQRRERAAFACELESIADDLTCV